MDALGLTCVLATGCSMHKLSANIDCLYFMHEYFLGKKLFSGNEDLAWTGYKHYLLGSYCVWYEISCANDFGVKIIFGGAFNRLTTMKPSCVRLDIPILCWVASVEWYPGISTRALRCNAWVILVLNYDFLKRRTFPFMHDFTIIDTPRLDSMILRGLS